MLYRFSRFLCIVCLKLFFGFRVQGQEVFPKKAPFILAANHASHLDPVIVGAGCPVILCYLAKKELFGNKFFGAYLRRLGAVPLQRGKADIKTLRIALSVLKTRPLVIFPQGTRTQDLNSFSAGVGFLCRKTGVPVIAARVYGTNQILPKGAKFFHRGKIRVVYAPVTTITKDDDYGTIAAKVMDTIRSL